MRSARLNTLLLVLITIGVLGNLGWNIHKDTQAAEQQRTRDDQARAIAVNQEKMHIYDLATDKILSSELAPPAR